MAIRFEPMPREKLPKSLREYPDLFANEMYRYRLVSKGLARRLYLDYEESLRAKTDTDGAVLASVSMKMGRKGGAVQFALAPVAMFFCASVASGIIGNLSYDALKAAVRRIRKPKREFPPNKITFESVISEKTYRRHRLEAHPNSLPSRTVSVDLEQQLETQYRLSVILTQDPPRRPKKRV
jgi:hypothetical protein